jgi:hypothetical protein
MGGQMPLLAIIFLVILGANSFAQEYQIECLGKTQQSDLSLRGHVWTQGTLPSGERGAFATLSLAVMNDIESQEWELKYEGSYFEGWCVKSCGPVLKYVKRFDLQDFVVDEAGHRAVNTVVEIEMRSKKAVLFRNGGKFALKCEIRN